MTTQEFQQKFNIIGKSQEIRDLSDVVMQVAPSDISILIYGESGVGKEVFARAIHGFSNRAAYPLVSVNCGAIPEGILESELFGHRKGSFTGALENRKGYFEIADNGTLFLDEIAEMPLTTQVKLLRAIETKEFMRIGGETVTRVNLRIIAATNKDLQKEVDSKRFREDLFFRLKAVTLYIPPLRKRKEDISELVFHFIKAYSESSNIPVPQITNEALDFLTNYNWPGNVRELKNSIETAIALSRSGVLDAESFYFLMKTPQDSSSRNLPVFLNKTPEDAERELIYRALFEIKKDLVELKQILYNKEKDRENGNYNIKPNEIIPFEVLEKDAIKNAIDYTKGNRRLAAKLLGISERTLYRKLQEYNIEI